MTLQIDERARTGVLATPVPPTRKAIVITASRNSRTPVSPRSAASTRSVTCAAVATCLTCRFDQVSRVGSGCRTPNAGSGSRTCAAQYSSWSPTAGDAARCHISSDHRRYEVCSGSISGAVPAVTARHASVRSPTMMCHDTTSTARWCTVSSSTCSCWWMPESQTARTVAPVRGSISSVTVRAHRVIAELRSASAW